MTWDMGRRLVEYSTDDTYLSFTYNANGQRIGKHTVDESTEFYYDDRGSLILLSHEDYTLYFYPDADGSIGSFSYDGEQYYYVRNAQNDVIGITDKNGNFVAKYTYDEWGKILTITDGNGVDVSANSTHIANLNPFRYRSYFYDAETGFYWLNTRYYDPAIGRFINADSFISGINGSVVGFNQYSYCFNNPVNFSDSSGAWTDWEIIKDGIKEAVDSAVQYATQSIINTVSNSVMGSGSGIFSPSRIIKGLHYNRNELNETYTLDELEDMEIEPEESSSSKFHQNNTVDGEENKKYVVGEWFSSEMVFFSDGTVNDTPEDMGTFNVYSGDNVALNVVIHGVFDVIPYMIWGNSEDDTTTVIDRVLMIFR